MAKELKYEQCPVCELHHPKLIHSFNQVYESDVIGNIKNDFPQWEVSQGICNRCYDEFEAITYHKYRGLENDIDEFKLKFLDFYILPIGTRLNAEKSFTGKGVTICFIDSGFYMHPDIKSRIKKIMDITDESRDENYFNTVHDNAWHGTMTSTICAGNGNLSRGLYKGLASEAELVLIKTQNDEGKITDENIIKALEWVKSNHELYNIRIVNLSLSGDVAEHFDTSRINHLAEELFAMNILVIAAVGNSTDGEVLPPASSPHVVAVGGLDDDNKLDGDIILYHSTYGVTLDGLSKPELISNAIWLPAPILPATASAKKAEVLFQALQNDDYIYAIIENNAALFKDDGFDIPSGKEKIWKQVKKLIWKEKFITPHYMHVDGTSFAAPIVSSVAAQMLEANPTLASNELRQILLKTALPLPTYDVARQGYGRLQPKMAVYAVMKKEDIIFPDDNPVIDYKNKKIMFYLHQPNVKIGLSLSGSFNNWKKNEIFLKPAKNDTWYMQMPLLPPGRYEYKFLADNQQWIEDVANPWRTVDNHGGWNNVFEIN